MATEREADLSLWSMCCQTSQNIDLSYSVAWIQILPLEHNIVVVVSISGYVKNYQVLPSAEPIVL
jgi:hypothetical protein